MRHFGGPGEGGGDLREGVLAVSSANVETARAFYPEGVELDMVEAMRREDAMERITERFGEMFQPDFETRAPESQVAPGGRGMRGFVEGWRDWLAPWETWLVTVTGFLEVENRVVVLFDIKARPKGAEADAERHGANVLTFTDGRIASIDLYMDRDEALRSTGLDPE
jgi:ketosteroid isomerase-like protein